MTADIYTETRQRIIDDPEWANAFLERCAVLNLIAEAAREYPQLYEVGQARNSIANHLARAYQELDKLGTQAALTAAAQPQTATGSAWHKFSMTYDQSGDKHHGWKIISGDKPVQKENTVHLLTDGKGNFGTAVYADHLNMWFNFRYDYGEKRFDCSEDGETRTLYWIEFDKLFSASPAPLTDAVGAVVEAAIEFIRRHDNNDCYIDDIEVRSGLNVLREKCAALSEKGG